MARIAVFLGFCLLLITKDLVGLGWQTWFYLHQREIAAQKCENNATPMLGCNGKCYLGKQLRKLDLAEREHEQKQNPTQGIELVFFFDPTNANPRMVSPSIDVVTLEKQLFSYQFSLQTNEANRYFHPPCVA